MKLLETVLTAIQATGYRSSSQVLAMDAANSGVECQREEVYLP